jgi:hypothetical protein
MLGYMWRLRFRERRDTVLSGFLWSGIAFSLSGYLGLALMFARSVMQGK